MTDNDKNDVLEEIRARRGFTLPVHEMMARVDPEILRAYNSLAGNLLFGPEPRALDLKTRYLVLVGVTTAVRGDADGIKWSSAKARELGATEEEILEAVLLAGLPGGIPAVEEAALALGFEYPDKKGH
ncbi:carboxymuconolactone decarboxylase family protein [Dactylosporangium salmoneum]|uniref:Carboxymuconolactone decarboxylase-like domain-containing protein n=1 Tax=Dactylosporangium salmoneum TaxID=53361 RepID=A0ABN3GCY7_9ACTN